MHPHLHPASEALPLGKINHRGPEGAWQICCDGVRGYYARRWYLGDTIVRSTDEVIEGETVDDVVARLPPGLINVGKADDDGPFVVEWWI